MGYVHVAFLVDNVDSTYALLSKQGYSFTVTPKMAGSGRGRLAFFNDPNGVKIEIIQRDDSFRIPKIIGEKIRSFDHISLIAKQLGSRRKIVHRSHGNEASKTDAGRRSGPGYGVSFLQ